MSTVRQRKGEAVVKESAPIKEDDVTQNDDDDKENRGEDRTKLAKQIMSVLSKAQVKETKSISHAAKGIKEALADDPYNLELIYELGAAYADDEEWDRCANVLLRGWKRVHEFESASSRVHFLIVLADASMHQKKYRQALSVVNDMVDVPADFEHLRDLETLRCNIFSQNDMMQKAMQSFKKATDGCDFDRALTVFAACLSSLKKIGAQDQCKSDVMALSSDEKDEQKIKAVEQVVLLKEHVELRPRPPRSKMMMVFGTFWLVTIFAVIVQLEMRSFASLQAK